MQRAEHRRFPFPVPGFLALASLSSTLLAITSAPVAPTQPASGPTTAPSGLPFNIDLSDPFTQRVLIVAAAFIALVIVLRIFGRIRENAASRRYRSELRRGMDEVRLQQEEVRQLAEQIAATSSTARIAGYAIVRQIETVFTEGRPTSVAALELLKGLAAQKGANGIINVQTRQMPTGKWVASGDAVLVRLIGRRGNDAATPPKP